MATQRPDHDLAAAMVAAGLATGIGADIAVGEPLSPTAPGATGIKFWVYALGGPPPVPYLGRDGTGHVTAEWNATLVVRVRDLTGDSWEASQTLARQVMQTMTFAAVTGYFDLRAVYSEPAYVGLNESNQHEWNVLFSLHWTA